tara:strand:- start:529 stop:831 length:303 start_codon:yes stop_codon:yes gene_type:complete
MTEDKKCSSGGSDLQVEGLNQVTLNTKLEMEYDRLGVSTVSSQNIDCKIGANHNMTGNLCRMKTPAHVMAFKATWDRALVSTCDRKPPVAKVEAKKEVSK